MRIYLLEPKGMGTATTANPGETATGPVRAGSETSSDFPAARIPSTAGLVRSPLPEARSGEPVPIWLAALFATSCEAQRNGENHAVRWNWISGRAVYTNASRDAEHIQPLGVSLLGGHTMAVYWVPGDTTYTVEVYRQAGKCA